jgi:hypothetical protein
VDADGRIQVTRALHDRLQYGEAPAQPPWRLTAHALFRLAAAPPSDRMPHMIGILLITHGTSAKHSIQCACHVMNRRPPQLMQLGISGQDDPLDALPWPGA